MTGGNTTNYLKIKEELDSIQQELYSIQLQLSNLPPGKIYYAKNGQYTRWYQSDGHTSTYISKSNFNIAQALAYKKYLLLKMEYLSKEYKILTSCFNRHNSNTNKAEKLLQECNEYNKILSDYLHTNIIHETAWENALYDQNPHFPEQLLHTSISKNILRSKSEYMIDSALFSAGISYRYECKLILDNNIFYPDFTILHPISKNILYWEHFGMIDNPDYSKKAFDKLRFYASHNILPNINLITTFETSKKPLTYDQIEKILDFYLLN